MVVHAGGLITLYAHNQRLLVVAGEHVEQGQRSPSSAAPAAAWARTCTSS